MSPHNYLTQPFFVRMLEIFFLSFGGGLPIGSPQKKNFFYVNLKKIFFDRA
jgi:hypothetical protein